MIDIAIPIFLILCGIVVVLVRHLLSAIMVFTIYSFAMAIEWVRLNALDVAITEAAVGAGITTVLFLALLSRTKKEYEKKNKFKPLALVITLGVTALLVYGTMDLPQLRDPAIPPSNHVVPGYLAGDEHGLIQGAYKDTGAHNVVTAILASYRGYDTLGEVTVVSTAGLCVILLLRQVVRERNYKGLKRRAGPER